MNIIKRVVSAVVGAVASIFASVVAFAASWIDVSGVTIDMSPVAVLGLTILGALTSMFVLRKLIGSANKC